jgi:hypothetical protein
MGSGVGVMDATLSPASTTINAWKRKGAALVRNGVERQGCWVT